MSSSEASVRFEADVSFDPDHVFRPCDPGADDGSPAGDPGVARPLAEFGGASEAERIRDEVAAEMRAEAEAQLQRIQSQVDERIRALVAEIERVRAEAAEELATQAADLAFAVAESLVGRAIEVDRGVVRHALRQAVEAAAGERELHLRVHPEDAESLREEKELLQALQVVEVLPDPRIEPGGCSLERGDRSWDATVSGRLEHLREAVREAMESAP